MKVNVNIGLQFAFQSRKKLFLVSCLILLGIAAAVTGAVFTVLVLYAACKAAFYNVELLNPFVYKVWTYSQIAAIATVFVVSYKFLNSFCYVRSKEEPEEVVEKMEQKEKEKEEREAH